MKKNILVSITTVCALIGVYSWIHSLEEQPIAPPPVTVEAGPQSVTIEASSAGETSLRELTYSRKTENNPKVLVIDESKLEAGDRQLAEIIADFDNNLDNPEKRRELESRLSEVSDEYKQQVLAKVKLMLDNEKRQSLE